MISRVSTVALALALAGGTAHAAGLPVCQGDVMRSGLAQAIQTCREPQPGRMCAAAGPLDAPDDMILKDARGWTQMLLVSKHPEHVGIESPAILGADAPHYFADAWRATPFVEILAGGAVPPESLSLAINAMCYRSQGRLHIHVDLVRRDVTTQLRPEHHPVESGVSCRGHRYAVREIASLDANLFAALGKPPDQMARETIVIVGRPAPDAGFYMLTGGDFGGEDLQVGHPRLGASTFQALLAAARGAAPAPPPPAAVFLPHDGDCE